MPGVEVGAAGALSRPVHDPGDTGEAEGRADEVESMGRDAIDGRAPDDGEHDEREAPTRAT